MLKRFKQYSEEYRLIAPGDKVLACVSGGVDSMTLLHLLYNFLEKDQIVVAHCNFMLRGAQSDAETAMVQRTCQTLGVKCRTIFFDTKAVCHETGTSVQMAARSLRYNWFEEICTEEGCSKIAIAHHSNDTVETFFINLMRGTGLRGLTGIGRTRNQIIRPLLFASRDEIESFAIAENIEYMTDSSNFNQDYLRNRLRYDILPRFDGSLGCFRETMGGNIERLSSAQRFIDSQVETISKEVLKEGELDLEKLKTYNEWEFILYEILKAYGFSGDVVSDICKATLSGKRFYAEKHIATLNRNTLLINSRTQEVFEERTIESNDDTVEWFDPCSISSLRTPSNIALLSGDRVKFPLTLRKWQHGDSFMPLGVTGRQKVSDFMINAKLSVVEKEKQGVVVDAEGNIVWLVGRRIDNRYKLTEATEKAIKLTL